MKIRAINGVSELKVKVRERLPEATFEQDGNSVVISVTETEKLHPADVMAKITEITGRGNAYWAE